MIMLFDESSERFWLFMKTFGDCFHWHILETMTLGQQFSWETQYSALSWRAGASGFSHFWILEVRGSKLFYDFTILQYLNNFVHF